MFGPEKFEEKKIKRKVEGKKIKKIKNRFKIKKIIFIYFFKLIPLHFLRHIKIK